ncbi:MAG: DUF4197 domain-containing protein [Bacteroidota bacterium]
MKKISLVLIISILTGCSELFRMAEEIDGQRPLTKTEVIRGLKQALTIGADSAASGLSVKNGYYGDPLVKINLPPEAQVVTDHASKIPGGEKLVEDVLLRINRSAENAASEAAPVFADAVRSMTIRDGFEILRGENDEATQYLKEQTYKELYNLYQPKIKSSIDKKIVGDVSTKQSWEKLTTQWNRVANSMVGSMANLEAIETELDRYLTEQALAGLFLKLAQEEEKIRQDPGARVTQLLQRVFGES